jgi:hypothetical protein
VNLLFIYVGVSLLGLIVGLVQTDAMRRQVAASNPTFTEGELDAAVAVGMIGMIMFGLVFIPVLTWLTFMIRKGANWARITVTVLLVLAVLLDFFFRDGTETALMNLVTVADFLLGLVILLLLWQRSATMWFSARGQSAR